MWVISRSKHLHLHYTFKILSQTPTVISQGSMLWDPDKCLTVLKAPFAYPRLQGASVLPLITQ